jgi:tetratricopeptide (TPR) repeat protein
MPAMSSSEIARARLREQASQIRRDLAELDGQVSAGELDAATAEELRGTYQAELDRVTAEFGGSGPVAAAGDAPETSTSHRFRWAAVGVAALVGMTVWLVSGWTDRQASDGLEGVAGMTGDLSAVSNETLEAVINANAGDPEVADQIPRMQLALAERHFTESAYDQAFDQYVAVAENPNTAPRELAVAIARIGWIAWVSTGDDVRALEALEQSLAIDPSNIETVYTKAQILWCGSGDLEQAEALLEDISSAADLPDVISDQVGADLAAVRAGGGCGVP